MGQLVLIAFRNLVQHSRRTLLLGGAILGVTALLVLLVGLLNGIRSTMLESATTLMSGHVNVGGFFKVTAGQSAPVVTHYREVERLVRENVPELSYLTQRGRGWAKVVSETGSIQSGVGGIDVRSEASFRRVIQIKEDVAIAHNNFGVALTQTGSVDEGIAKELQIGLGDEVVFDVQGVPIVTRVASLREVDWRRIQPNFFVVFPRASGHCHSLLCQIADGWRAII